MIKRFSPNKSKILLISVFLFLSSALPTVQAVEESYIVNCNLDCLPLIEKVSSFGGKITNKYQNINAFSITVDVNYIEQLLAISPTAEFIKDKIFKIPSPKDSFNLSGVLDFIVLEGVALADFISAEKPKGFEFNNVLTGAADMNAAGFTGDGTIVALIDTGTANNSTVVTSLSGSIIGGESFVPGADEPSATSTLNNNHGTNTGSMIAGHAFFLFDSASDFAQSVLTHLPGSIIYNYLPGVSVIPMFGSAPDAKLYAMKVFAATEEGAPESRIIAAMDRAITLRTNYNNGVPVITVNPGCGAEDDPCVYDSLNIGVVNMSLGGDTLYAAKDLEDQLTNKMLEVGITLVASAGNEGFAAITGSSPGTGLGSLTVGAASVVGNERVLRDLQFELGLGVFYRPSNHHQMATFSSRGPSTDGRFSTNVVANGFACLVQGVSGDLSLASGTSFSAPMVAGAAATLVEAFPEKPAIAIRNSLIQSANPNILGDDSAAIDQGAGFINVPLAYGLLATDTVNTSLPEGKGDEKVEENIEDIGLKIISTDKKKPKVRKLSNLKPGQVEHFFIESEETTDKITIKIKNIVPSLVAAEQNLFFGDDIYYVLQNVMTHAEATIASGFITLDEEIEIDHPQTGILRLAVMGDWTNAGGISADVSILGKQVDEVEEVAEGNINQNETQIETFYIPDGITQVVFELSWKNNWSAYPTDDIDLILFDPNLSVLFDGATLSSPERVVIDNPTAGEWMALIQGFTIHNVNDDPGSRWEMRITNQDGNSL